MTRLRLRSGNAWYELSEGEFVVGRTPGCNLVLDDPRASRRHARFVVERGRVTVEDLQSRNGTRVNGVLLRAPQVVTHRDVVTIGSQELLVTLSPRDEGDEPTTGDPIDAELALQHTTTGDLLPVVMLLDQAAQMPGHREAGAILQRFYAERDHKPAHVWVDVGAHVLDGVARLTVLHAVRSREGHYLDRLFELHQRERAVMPAELIEDVAGVVRKIGHGLSQPLRAYAEWMRGEAERFGPSERYSLQRLEELVRELVG